MWPRLPAPCGPASFCRGCHYTGKGPRAFRWNSSNEGPVNSPVPARGLLTSEPDKCLYPSSGHCPAWTVGTQLLGKVWEEVSIQVVFLNVTAGQPALEWSTAPSWHHRSRVLKAPGFPGGGRTATLGFLGVPPFLSLSILAPWASCVAIIRLQSWRHEESPDRAELWGAVGIPLSAADCHLWRRAPTFRTFLMPLMVEVSKECTLRSSLT